jgi:deoxycytidylate deaminase
MKHGAVLQFLGKIAEDSADPELTARLAAAIVYKGDIISIGVNKKKSHPFQLKYSKMPMSIFLHAETDAIKNAVKRVDLNTLSRSTLYISRVKYYDSSRQQVLYGLAKPCDGCEKAIATFNIKHVCYSLNGEGYEFL